MYNHGVGPEISPDVLALQLFKVSPDGKLLKKVRWLRTFPSSFCSLFPLSTEGTLWEELTLCKSEKIQDTEKLGNAHLVHVLLPFEDC
jgi:hypothetical protein